MSCTSSLSTSTWDTADSGRSNKRLSPTMKCTLESATERSPQCQPLVASSSLGSSSPNTLTMYCRGGEGGQDTHARGAAAAAGRRTLRRACVGE